jgi:ribonuclease P protein component
MGSGHAWRLWRAAECWRRGGRRAVNAYPLEPLISANPSQSPRNSTDRRLVTLKTRADFLRVAATRRRAVTAGLILQTGRRPEGVACDLSVRVGFTASRKVGNAVTRNRAKRRLRSAAAAVLPGQAKPGTDYVLIARGSTVTRPYVSLVADLEAALRRVDHRGREDRPGVAEEE